MGEINKEQKEGFLPSDKYIEDSEERDKYIKQSREKFEALGNEKKFQAFREYREHILDKLDRALIDTRGELGSLPEQEGVRNNEDIENYKRDLSQDLEKFTTLKQTLTDKGENPDIVLLLDIDQNEINDAVASLRRDLDEWRRSYQEKERYFSRTIEKDIIQKKWPGLRSWLPKK